MAQWCGSGMFGFDRLNWRPYFGTAECEAVVIKPRFVVGFELVCWWSGGLAGTQRNKLRSKNKSPSCLTNKIRCFIISFLCCWHSNEVRCRSAQFTIRSVGYKSYGFVSTLFNNSTADKCGRLEWRCNITHVMKQKYILSAYTTKWRSMVFYKTVISFE